MKNDKILMKFLYTLCDQDDGAIHETQLLSITNHHQPFQPPSFNTYQILNDWNPVWKNIPPWYDRDYFWDNWNVYCKMCCYHQPWEVAAWKFNV